jgi:hypothetical protein
MSFLIYPTIKESPFLSVLGMGGGGTGTVIGGAGPDMSEDYNTNTYYVIIPYYAYGTGGSGNRIALFNPTTGKYAADFETSTSTGRIYRFGDGILVTSNWSRWYKYYHYSNNWTETSGQFATSYVGDEVKISSDRLWTLSWETSGSNTATVRVYSAGGSGNIGLQFSYTTTSMGYRNSAFGGNMIDNPVIGAQANVNASTGILSSLSRLHVKAPDGNNSNAHERRSVVTISNNTNGSFSVSSTSSNSGNYSRPIAGTGWDGYCYTSGMDGARNYVTSGGTASGWSGSTVQPPANGFHGVGVLGRSGRFISIVNSGGTHYFAWVTTGGASLQYAIPTTTGATVQQYPNGCATCDYDSTVNKIRVRIYNSSSGWSTMYAATEYSPVNMLNYGYRKIITY